MIYRHQNIFTKMNELSSQKIPHLFIIDYLKENGVVAPLAEIPESIRFEINPTKTNPQKKVALTKHPIPFEQYKEQFDLLHKAFRSSDLSQINLTAATPVDLDLTLEEIYKLTHAKYKILWKDKFVCFSPETFVKIKDGKIYAHPMKGTINADVKDAEQQILADPKELHEHRMVVNMLMDRFREVAQNVDLNKFRYIDKVMTGTHSILQTSSEITGELSDDFQQKLGDLFNHLLPADSICGVPKNKAVEWIQKTENYNRGFYTGIFGVFDGENTDSAVLIRFVEKTANGLVFKSGGGITEESKVENEYNELIAKVYVPVY